MGSKGAQKLLRMTSFFLSYLWARLDISRILILVRRTPDLISSGESNIRLSPGGRRCFSIQHRADFLVSRALSSSAQQAHGVAIKSQIKSISPITCSLPFSSFLL